MIVTVGLLIALLICVVSYLAIRELRLRDMNNEKHELIALDLLLEEETERTLESVDLVLTSLQDDLTLGGVAQSQEFTRKHSSIAVYALLKSRIIGIPQLKEVSIFDADGRLINVSREYPAPEISVEDTDYFKALQGMPSDVPFLSHPTQVRGMGKWTIYLARRIEHPEGKFVGIVVAAIDLGYFENLYKSLQVGNDSAVSLWRRDGTLLARYPPLPGIGRTFNIRSFGGILRSDAPVTYAVNHSLDNKDRLVATMAVRQFPLVVNISKSVDEILADWHQMATLIAGGAAICVLALCFVLWRLVREFNAYEALAIADEERNKAVAEREQVEAQLRQAQKLESIGQLTGGIAHDFNNLLTAVLGNLELLKKHTEKSETRLYRWAKNAFDAASRGAVLTQRLLVFSRRQPLEPRAADVATLLSSMSDLLHRTLGENIEITTQVAPDLWCAFADLNQLDNAILNIAINARDAMEGRGKLVIDARNCLIEEGAENYEIKAGEITAGEYVLLSLSDTGKGIDKDVLDRVFEPFFSTKPVGKGTGLGLSQVYGFVKQTGGHVKIDSVPSEGTTVKLYLPRAIEEADAAVDAAQVEEGPEGQYAGTVLVVEDDADVRTYSAEILRDLGYRVQEANDAHAALEILKNGADFTLLFSDVGLPGMSGPELVEEALRMRPRLKILLTTGYGQNALTDRCRFEHGIQLIPKPFARAELAQKIASVLMPMRQYASG